MLYDDTAIYNKIIILSIHLQYVHQKDSVTTKGKIYKQIHSNMRFFASKEDI